MTTLLPHELIREMFLQGYRRGVYSKTLYIRDYIAATHELRASMRLCTFDEASGLMFVLPYITTAGALCILAVLAVVFIERTIYRGIAERSRELAAYHEEQRRMLLDLAHNLHTPLTILKTRLEQLERTRVHDGDIVGLRGSVDTITHFINELLSFAYLEDSLRKEPKVTFSLSDLVSDVWEEAETLVESRGISLQGGVAPDIHLFGNDKRIREAVMSLLCNAVKYMGTEAPREIHITLATVQDVAHITVRDTGMGIREDELPHIFERFYRGSARRYDDVPGTGLGLAIVERIVKEHDGSIIVTSEPSNGSTFTLVLPYAHL